MATNRTLAMALSAVAVLAMAVPAGAQLKAEPIVPKQQDHRTTFDFTVGHERLGGADRYETALAVSKRLYADHAATQVMLASGEDFPDAIAALNMGKPGTPVPTLLTQRDAIPSSVVAELKRIAAPNAIVTVVGGEKAIAPAVQDQLRDLGFTTNRVAGANRAETSKKLAEQASGRSSSVAVISPADEFATSIVAAAYANRIGAIHVLAFDHPDRQLELATWLNHAGITQVHAVGEPMSYNISMTNVIITGTGKQEVWVDQSVCYPEEKDCITPAVLAPPAVPSQQIAEYIWRDAFKQDQTFVVINGERPVDGIAAGQLAVATKSPILTTFSTSDSRHAYGGGPLNHRYVNLMIRDGAKNRNFFFVGGEQALTKEVEDTFVKGL